MTPHRRGPCSTIRVNSVVSSSACQARLSTPSALEPRRGKSDTLRSSDALLLKACVLGLTRGHQPASASPSIWSPLRADNAG